MTKDTTSFIDDLADIPGLNDLSARSTTPRTARDADDDTDDARPAKADDRPTFPCESCGGTGRYKGVRIHQPAVECFACKGRGYFFTSYKDRLAARTKAANRKQQRITHGLELFEETHPGLLADMRKHASWNDFLRDLVAKLELGLDLSDRAIEAAQRTVDKARAREQDRAREQLSQLANAATVDAAPLKAAFDAASRNGLKRPVLRYDGFEVSRAPDHGKNAGALYVKAGDTYLGKITSDRYLPTREAEQIGIVARVIEAMQGPAHPRHSLWSPHRVLLVLRAQTHRPVQRRARHWAYLCEQVRLVRRTSSCHPSPGAAVPGSSRKPKETKP